MSPFEYCRPASLGEAIELKRGVPEASWLAGGMTLLPSMKLRLAAPTRLVDLADLAELRTWAIEQDRIVLGSMTTHRAVARSGELRESIPALCTLAAGIGDPQVRNRGTLGGSIANNDPAADYPAALLALDATIQTNQRELDAAAFFGELFETALADDELVVSVTLPVPRRAAYMKFRTPGSRYALVGVMVAETRDGVRVAVTGAGAGVRRFDELEGALEQEFRPEALTGITVSPDGLNEDLHGSAAYRAHLIGVMARRATAQAIAAASRGGRS